MYRLLDSALNNAAEEKGISRDYLAQLAPGSHKRSLVDDITIIVLNLQGQAKK